MSIRIICPLTVIIAKKHSEFCEVPHRPSATKPWLKAQSAGIDAIASGFCWRQLGNQSQWYGQPFQLIMGSQVESWTVITRVTFIRLHYYFSGSQWFASLRRFRWVLWISINILINSFIKPYLHIFLFLERTNLVSNNAFQIMRKTTGCKKIR